MRSPTYEIIFSGQAGTTLRAEFDDCEVTIGPGTTTLRAELPDQAALTGLVLRITGLNLEIMLVRLVAPPSADRESDMTDARPLAGINHDNLDHTRACDNDSDTSANYAP